MTEARYTLLAIDELLVCRGQITCKSHASIWLVLHFRNSKENASYMFCRLGGGSSNHVCPTTAAILSIAMLGNIYAPGGRLNKKDGLTRYGDSHVKDKTS